MALISPHYWSDVFSMNHMTAVEMSHLFKESPPDVGPGASGLSRLDRAESNSC